MNDYLHTAFNLLSFLPGPFWLALIFLPKNRHAMMAFDVFLVLLSLHFTLLTLPDVAGLLPVIASPTFEAISALLSAPKGILGSWNHMIFSDLWVGRWIAYDGLRQGFNGYVRAIFILITLFFGPVGFCLYWLARLAIRRKWRLGDAAGNY
ncbi:MAG: ABA4-like family protein [Bdellovibrionota bacterium]